MTSMQVIHSFLLEHALSLTRLILSWLSSQLVECLKILLKVSEVVRLISDGNGILSEMIPEAFLEGISMDQHSSDD
jgi:hypothetical protein